MRKTKIVCTLGPASCNEEMLQSLFDSGMNVGRINFSHGTHEEHKKTIDLFRKVRDKNHLPAAVMLDTKGPEIRVKTFQNGSVTLVDEQTFTLTAKDVEGTGEIVSVTYADLPKQLQPGNKILIDDGKIELEVTDTTETDIHCRVLTGGEIRDRKGVNVPYIHLDFPYLSEQDQKDLIFGVEMDVDFVAASFVRCKEDVIQIRNLLDYHGGHKIKIIAKIENTEGVENFDEILKHSDGIMVARGDMGVEIAYERLPGLQKRFIKKCYESGKMAIIATQMLESMIHSTTPTRAEITDVANAVFDGTSAIMLSGETAIGDHPDLVVQVMSRIATQAENDAFDLKTYSGVQYVNDAEDTTNALCDAACIMANDVKADAIIAVTKSGYTARRVSKFRPPQTIVASTPENKTFHQLSLSWGVNPVLGIYQQNAEVLFTHAIDCAKMFDYIQEGDRVVITAGTDGVTDVLKLQTVASNK